jgi:hypothetical protein
MFAEELALRKEIAKLKIEVDELRLQLDNVLLLLKTEMTESGKLPKVDRKKRR